MLCIVITEGRISSMGQFAEICPITIPTLSWLLAKQILKKIFSELNSKFILKIDNAQARNTAISLVNWRRALKYKMSNEATNC